MKIEDDRRGNRVPDPLPNGPKPGDIRPWTPNPNGGDRGREIKEHITEVSETVPVPVRKEK